MNRKNKTYLRLSATILILGLVFLCCTLGGTSVNAASNIKLNRSYVITSKGAIVPLKITGTSNTVKWSSSEPAIAKVSKTGNVTALKNGSAVITATINKKEYTCNIYVGTFTFDSNFNSNNIPIDKYRNETVDINFIAGNSYADLPVADVKISAGNKELISWEYETRTKNNTEYIVFIRIFGLKDGKTDLNVTIGKITKTLKITVGTGTGRLDPVDAIKQRDYVGYTEAEAGTLKKVAEIIDNNNLNANTLSVEDKLRAIQTYFNTTYYCNPDVNMEGDIANILFNGHGYLRDYYGYTITLALFCDCLDIPYVYCDGGAFIPKENDFIKDTWLRVKINDTWYYIDPHMNAWVNGYDYFLSKSLWEDHDLLEEGADLSYFNNYWIKFIDEISMTALKE